MFYDDSIRVILRHLFYEYHYSLHKLAFQNIMRAGDQKLMIDLEWPYISVTYKKAAAVQALADLHVHVCDTSYFEPIILYLNYLILCTVVNPFCGMYM